MASVEYWQAGPHAGYRVIWYRDDDNNSGYGLNARQAIWYADSLQDAHELAKRKGPPRGTKWLPLPWQG